MKSKRELAIAMVLVGLVGVNFFYLLDIFFSGLHRVLFRSENQFLIDWPSAILVIFANVVALVGLFYLVRPQPGALTEGGLTQGAPREDVPTPGGPTETGPRGDVPTPSGPTETGPTETGPTPSGPTEGGPTERQGN